MEKLPIIEAKNLSHRFPSGKWGLKGVNLQVLPGSFMVITGKNGSGKSLLTRHFNGLMTPSSGEVLFRGKPVKKNLLDVRQKVGMVFQSPDSQFLGQTVEDDTAFGPRNLGLSAEEVEARTLAALDTVGLGDFRKERPYFLSGGEKRKLAIAGILAMRPEVVVFDEPFANLDYSGVRQVISTILALHKNGHTIIVITHDLEKILAYATEMVVMREGEAVFSGRPEDVLDDLEKYDVRRPYGDLRERETMTWLT